MILRTVSPCSQCGYLIDITEELKKDIETYDNYIDIKIFCPLCEKETWTRIKNNTDII